MHEQRASAHRTEARSVANRFSLHLNGHSRQLHLGKNGFLSKL